MFPTDDNAAIHPNAYEKVGDTLTLEQIKGLLAHEPTFVANPEKYLTRPNYARAALIWSRVGYDAEQKGHEHSHGYKMCALAGAMAKLVRLEGFDKMASAILGLKSNGLPEIENVKDVITDLIDLRRMLKETVRKDKGAAEAEGAEAEKEYVVKTPLEAAIVYQNHIIPSQIRPTEGPSDGWLTLREDLEAMAMLGATPLKHVRTVTIPEQAEGTETPAEPIIRIERIERDDDSTKNERLIGTVARTLSKGCEISGLFKAMEAYYDIAPPSSAKGL